MTSSYHGSVFKFKNMEKAYDLLSEIGLYNIAEQIAAIFEKEGYFPVLVRNKYRFKFKK